MSPYRSLMPTDRPTALGNLLTPMAEGFASGLAEDRLRRRNLEDQVTAYRTLMPLQLEMAEKEAQLKQRYPAKQYTPISKDTRYLIGPDGKLLDLGTPAPEGHSMDFLFGRNVEVPQDKSVMAAAPGDVNYGAGEEAASGTVPPTKTMRGNDLMAILEGLDPKQYQPIPHVSAEGKRSYGFQQVPRPQTAPAPHYLTKPDGSTWVVDTPGAEPRQIQPPIKVAQPFTEPAIAGMLSGAIPLPPGVTRDQVLNARDELVGMQGQKTYERTSGGIRAQGDNIQLISNIAEAKALGGLTDDVIRQRSKQTNVIQGIMNRLAQDKAYQGALGRLKAELAEDETGTPLGAKLQEIRTSGKPLSGTAASDVVRYNQYLRAANLLRKEFTNAEILKYVGYGRFQAKQLEQFIVTDPRFMRFMTLNEQLRGTAFGEGGKQLTPFEASVVFGYTPTGREAWGEYYLAKLDEIVPRFEMLMQETIGAHKTPRGKYVPSQTPKENRGTVNPSSVDPLDGRTATGPNGEKIIRRNGTWQPLK